MPDQNPLLFAERYARLRVPPTNLEAIIAKEIQEGIEVTVEALKEARGDLKVALATLRIMKQGEAFGVFHDRSALVEDRMVKSLARQHALLGSLGCPMAQPATHPEVS